MTVHRRVLTTIGIVVTSASAAVALPAITGARTPDRARTITVQVKVVDIAKDDVAPKSRSKVSLGDRLITRQSLYDANRKAVGTLYTDCSGVGPTKPVFGATLQCLATYRFGDGQIVAAGTTRLTGGTPLPVVGGSGAYAGARGSVQLTQPARGFDSADVITIDG